MSNMHDTVNQLLFTITLYLNLPVTSWFAATYFVTNGLEWKAHIRDILKSESLLQVLFLIM